MQSNFEVLGVRASTYEFEGDTAGYCQIYPSLLNLGLPLIPCMSSGHLGFNHGMFNEDHFDNCYRNIHLTNTGIALLDFFFQSTFHTYGPTVSWVVLVLHTRTQKPREVN